MSLVARTPQPTLAWQFQSSNVDYVTGLAPNLSTPGTYAAPTGGTITTVSGKRIHTFTSGTSSITFLVPVTAEVLVVAGGGGGGAVSSTTFSPGGGGGAGEVFYSATYSIAPGTYTVTVGGGGAGGPQGGTSQNGSASVFGSVSANGGGHGGNGGSVAPDTGGGDGGSGGGSERGAGAGGLSVKTAGGQGNNGGASTGFSGAGGGGAGGVGVNQTDATTSSVGTAGGPGVSYSITGSAVTYGAGGKGGDRGGTATNGANGAANSGNGGGGASTASGATGGNGGSGRVVISYNAALYPAPTYVTGKYGQAISFNNTLSPGGADPNCYVTYDVSTFGLTSNSTTLSLWANSGLTYPIATGNPAFVNIQGASYNMIFTPSATFPSNITMRCAGRDVGTSAPAQTGVWNHYCAVFSNVGASSSNVVGYFYANALLIGSANIAIQNLFTTLNLGCQDSRSNGCLCSIDDVRLFGTALSAAQIKAIYAAQGMPSVALMTNTGDGAKIVFR